MHLVDLEQLDLEFKRRIRRNHWWESAGAVCLLRMEDENDDSMGAGGRDRSQKETHVV